MKKFSYYIMLVTLFVSCKNEPIKMTPRNTVEIEERYEIHNASDVFCDVQLISLETSKHSLLGEIKKIIFKNNKFYILDNSGFSIYIFDENGKYINKIHKRGKGSGEYIEISDFVVGDANSIFVLDRQAKLFLEYTSENKFIKHTRLSWNAHSMEFLNDELVVLSCSGQENGIIIWDRKNDKMIKSYMNSDLRFSGVVGKPLIKHNNNVLFKRRNDNNIYNVSTDSLVVDWVIDFGSKNIVSDKLVKGFAGAYYPLDDWFSVYDFIETDGYITFMYQSAKIDYPFYVYFSKNTKNKKIITYKYNGDILYHDNLLFNMLPPVPLVSIDTESFISVINPLEWIENTNKCNLETFNAADKERWNYITKDLQNVKNGDNPILAIYKLKQF